MFESWVSKVGLVNDERKMLVTFVISQFYTYSLPSY